MPVACQGGAAVVWNDKIILIGGTDASGNIRAEVFMYDLESGVWSSLASMPTARYGHRLGILENKIWVIGGNDGSDLNIVEIYDPLTDMDHRAKYECEPSPSKYMGRK